MKYYNAEVTFREVPDEVSLCINISGCPNHCPDCHSKWLWDDIGTELNEIAIDRLMIVNPGITCVSFMGGDQSPVFVREMAKYVKETYRLKTCWYSGRLHFSVPNWIYADYFDYVKFGPYIEEYGGLDNPKTNQIFFRWNETEKNWEDITYYFIKKINKTNEAFE